MREQRHPAKSGEIRPTGFRVWIAACKGWQPTHPLDRPPEAMVLEPAEDGVLSAAQAACYVETFNRAALARGLRVWAIAIPVTVRYEGDVLAGQTVALPACRHSLSPRRNPPCVRQASARAGPQGFAQSPHRSR